MADDNNEHRRDDQGAVRRDDENARYRLDEDDHNLLDSGETPQKQDYIGSRGFQILVTVLFAILVLVLCTVLVLLVIPGEAGAATPVIVTLFGVLITGIFVFMTLRIESGARKEAQAVAQTEARYQADLAATAAASTEARRVAEIEAVREAARVAREVAQEEFDRILRAVGRR